jgi:hypothetical protein
VLSVVRERFVSIPGCHDEVKPFFEGFLFSCMIRELIRKGGDMVKGLLWFNGLAFLAFGVVCLVSPGFPTGLSGLEFASGDAPIEIRAQYGGVFLAVAILSIYSALRAEAAYYGLLMLALVYGGLAAGRFLGLLLDPGPAGNYTYFALAWEVIFTVILGVALYARFRPAESA